MFSIVAILETPDGKRHTVTDDWDFPTTDGIEHMWNEGNYSCDCNRRLFIERLRNGGFDGETPCGETIKLVELLIDGEKVRSWDY